MKPLNIENVPSEIINGNQLKLLLPPIQDNEFPTVSIVTPTYNRKDFIDLMVRNWNKIDYPRHLLEWIIVDDSETTECYNKLMEIIGNSNSIRIIYLEKHLTIGEKRNYLASLAKHKYIVHMDDDDFYPNISVAARIRALLQFEKKIKTDGCIGCTKVLCYDLITDQTFESYDQSTTIDKIPSTPVLSTIPSTISESTLAYSKNYWNFQKFNDNDTVTECLEFIKNRENTLCNIPSSYVITQLTHMKNTINRRMRSNISTSSEGSFMNTLVVSDFNLINNLRAKVISEFPEWKIAKEFIVNYSNSDPSKLKKKLIELENKHGESILKNPLIIELKHKILATKKGTTGKDLVYYCGPGKHFNFTSKWNPESKIIGGSEEAVINLTNEFANRGWNVTVYCVLDGPEKTYTREQGQGQGHVSYKNYWNWIPGNRQDLTIIWRDPSILSMYEINSKKIILDLHDAINPRWLDEIFNCYNSNNLSISVKSNFHAKILELTDSKIVKIVPNGITKEYKLDKNREKNNNKLKRVPNSLLCTSSPDRCLLALLRAMPIIRKEVPDAEIYWAYGFSAGVSEGGLEKDSRPEVAKWVSDAKELIKNTEGFNDLGRLSQSEIKEWYSKSDLFIYGTTFPEIDCISLTKAMASGACPVVSSAGAMAEKIGAIGNFLESSIINSGTLNNIDSSLKEGQDFDNWVQNIVLKLKDNERDNERIKMSEMTYKNYNWKTIVDKWIN